jgi:hypothetical protein
MLFGASEIPLLPGAPPGEYLVQGRVYTLRGGDATDVLDTRGQPSGKTFSFGPIAVAASSEPPNPEELAIAHPLVARLNGGIALLGYDLGHSAVNVGTSLPVTLFLSPTSALEDHLTISLQVRNAAGDLIAINSYEPANIHYPTNKWPVGTVVRGQYALIIPSKAEAGFALLAVSLADEEGQAVESPLILAEIEIKSPERLWEVPDVQRPSGAQLGAVCTLIGADLEPQTLKLGETLHLTLYWRAEEGATKSYTVFTHLLDRSGEVVAQHDSKPDNGKRPTTGWVPGEIVRDVHHLNLPRDVEAGEYVLEVGMYHFDEPGMPRLPIVDNDGSAIGDRVLLSTVAVAR